MGNTYKVIEIIDEYSVLINYGRSAGASKGDSIRILAKGPEVIDPETQQILGTLDAVKAELVIELAYDKFSLCKDIKIVQTNALLSSLSQFQFTTKEAEPLKVDADVQTHKKPPSDTTIRVGDIVEAL